MPTLKLDSLGRANHQPGINTRSLKGLTHIRERAIWRMMKRRCSDPNHPNFHRYGGRGIRVCERWMDFKNFLADVGERPSKRHTLDRYPNNNGNYEPGNVRWATKEEQNRNRNDNRLLEFRGQVKCVAEWSEITGISVDAIRSRIKRGWDAERTLTEMPTLVPRTKNHPAVKINFDPLFHTARQTL